MSKNYFEIKYKGPWKGVNVNQPEDSLTPDQSPYMVNFILKNGEIRTRPQQSLYLPGPSDGNPILFLHSFFDSNNVYHTCCVTSTGLWQLNRAWTRAPSYPKVVWSLIGAFPVQPGPNNPAAVQVFIDKIFWTNGGTNIWSWDGITSINAPSLWKANTAYIQGAQVIDSNGKVEIAGNSGISGSTVPAWSATLGGTVTDNTGTGYSTVPIVWTQGGKPTAANGFSAVGMVDATNGVTAGAYFLIELNAQLLMLNTVESVGGNFPQRIRWTPSGLPTIWDPNVNIGAGFVDELDVPDSILGALTVGTTAFILRQNGITEVTSTGQGINPFAFNHLWASDRGIGNIYPYGYAAYGPLGVFISSDDIYNISLGGFNRIGGSARDAIFSDLYQAVGNPVASIIPYYQLNYVYNHYKLCIPQTNGMKIWNYSLDDSSWQSEFKSNTFFTGHTRYCYTG
jgi:hypothetical protein